MILTQVLPQPVPIRLAGVDYLARQLRLKDVARLQQWIATVTPCPASVYRPIWESLEGEQRQIVAAQAYTATEKWPPEIATTDGDAVLFQMFPDDRRHGVEMLLGIVLDATPSLDAELIQAIASNISIAEFGEITAVAYGIDILDELATILDLPPDLDRGPESPNWGKVFWEVIEATGYTPDQIGDLYLSQFKAIRSQGDHARGQIPMRPGVGIVEESQRRQRLFAGQTSEGAEWNAKSTKSSSAPEDRPKPTDSPKKPRRSKRSSPTCEPSTPPEPSPKMPTTKACETSGSKKPSSRGKSTASPKRTKT